MLPATNAVVWGLLYSLSERDLKLLDGYESAPDHYRRELIETQLLDGSQCHAWTYLVQQPLPFVAPSRKYLEQMKRAASMFDFPNWYQQMLQGIPTIETTQEATQVAP